MLNYHPASPRTASPSSPRPLGQVPLPELPVAVPPFGLPPIASGIILTAGGLVGGAVGIYLAMKGSRVIGKKVPTFWKWYFNIGGVGATMAILGAIPLVALGVMEIAGGIIIKKKLEELNLSVQPPSGK